MELEVSKAEREHRKRRKGNQRGKACGRAEKKQGNETSEYQREEKSKERRRVVVSEEQEERKRVRK